MGETWPEAVPELSDFAQVADPAQYAPVPDDWCIGVADVVNSTAAIQAGRYKAVNLAGAAVISAVSNAFGGVPPLFVFGGDGARFVVPPELAATASDAMSRVAMWVERDLGLQLRVGITTVADVRSKNADLRAAYWRASDNVRYAMFIGGGMEHAERQLKDGAILLAPAGTALEPDLRGLSCQWGPIHPEHGKIVSLIVKRAPDADHESFAAITSKIVGLLEGAELMNPVPAVGPNVRWPSAAIALQSRIARNGHMVWRRRLHVLAAAALAWVIFKLGIPLGRFDPEKYRREISLNTDFRKFDDALMMTLECPTEMRARLGALLEEAADEGLVRYGLHVQDEAIMTCIVPSVMNADHMHFVDGADGGYALAAQQLRCGHPNTLLT